MPDCERLRNMPPHVELILKRLEDAGYEAYLVGGCVRDALMGKEPKDWDICTSATPEETRAVFGELNQQLSGMKHGTVSVIAHHVMYEITTFRTEGSYSDHRHPDQVQFVRKLDEDLSRRDFTMNAMAYSPRTGVVDLYGGLEDLNRGIVRCVGLPSERFGEDALRMFRALRFASVLDFDIDSETARAVHAQLEEAADVAVERLKTEWFKLLEGRGRTRVLGQYPDVVFWLFPETLPQAGLFHMALEGMEKLPPDPVIQMSALLGFMIPEKTEEQAEEIMRRFRCSNQETESVRVLSCFRFWNPDASRPAVHRKMIEMGAENLQKMLEIRLAFCGEKDGMEREACRAGIEMLEYLVRGHACRSIRDLQITGFDMQKLGYRGKDIGKGLEQLLLDVADGAVPNEHEALAVRAAERKEGG